MTWLSNAINKLRYADTFHIEFISILGSLFYFPELMDDCIVQESIVKLFYYTVGVIGIVSFWRESIQWRYLHVRCMLITYLIPIFTIISRNAYHPLHLKLLLFQLLLSIYLVWRVGTEKMYRRQEQKRRCQNG